MNGPVKLLRLRLIINIGVDKLEGQIAKLKENNAGLNEWVRNYISSSL